MGNINSTSSILALWVPVAVFAHLFSSFWLLKTVLLKQFSNSQALLRKKKKGKKSDAEHPPPPALGTGPDVSKGVTPLPSADQDLESDQEKASPFADPDTFKTATSSEGSMEGLDDVPDVSPMACSTLRQHLSVVPDRFDMEWQEMGCSYNIGGSTKVVLQDVWGRAKPGEMQALMGPSGAGKSTFMDILAMRKSVGSLSGRLLLSGKPATRSFIRQTAYVPQEDNFVPTMTTKETLDFYASVILPSEWSKHKKHERVMEVLNAVGLGNAHKTLVGGTLPGGLMMRGLSGGERKRLSIAAGILAAPAVLFLDEPTSGLDSFAALSVMGHLQRMARAAEHIIITTIHQPRSAIWQMFDMVTLLANGRLMFHGPREDMVEWFGSLGYVHNPLEHGVASDWALDLVAVGFAKPAKYYGHTMRNKEDLAAASKAFKDHYMRTRSVTPADSNNSLSDMKGTIADRVRSVITKGAAITDIQPDKGSKYPTGAMRQFFSLLHREFVLITRNPFDVAARTLTFTWVAILIGLLYYGMPDDGTSLRARLNLCYVGLSFVVLMPYISMGLYTSDKKFYLADASAKLYRPVAYYLAKVCVTTPFQIICALCFAWTLYGMAGMRHGGEYIGKWGCIVTLVYLISVQVLHACAIFAPNQDTAFMMSIVWTTVQMLVSTFFVNFSEVTFNYWLTQLRYVSAVYFGFEALVLNEFSGVYLDCSAGLGPGYMSFVLTAFPKLTQAQTNILKTLQNPQPGCVVDTKAVVDYFEFGRPFSHTVGILLGYLGILHILTYLAMVLSARKEAR